MYEIFECSESGVENEINKRMLASNTYNNHIMYGAYLSIFVFIIIFVFPQIINLIVGKISKDGLYMDLFKIFLLISTGSLVSAIFGAFFGAITGSIANIIKDRPPY